MSDIHATTQPLRRLSAPSPWNARAERWGRAFTLRAFGAHLEVHAIDEDESSVVSDIVVANPGGHMAPAVALAAARAHMELVSWLAGAGR